VIAEHTRTLADGHAQRTQRSPSPRGRGRGAEDENICLDLPRGDQKRVPKQRMDASAEYRERVNGNARGPRASPTKQSLNQQELPVRWSRRSGSNDCVAAVKRPPLTKCASAPSTEPYIVRPASDWACDEQHPARSHLDR